MSAPASEIAERAQNIVARLADALEAGRSRAHVQLICSELFEAVRIESEWPGQEPDRREMLSAALDLCGRAGDPTVNAALRLAHLRAVVALLQGGLAAQPEAAAPRFRVIQGGLA